MATGVARKTRGTRSLKQDRTRSNGRGNGHANRRATPARPASSSIKVLAPSRSRGSGIKRAKSASAEHAVFLVPGLLGFENISTFTYFADRVVAALRAGLEQALGQPVPVIALPIPPTASLRERQVRLARSMADRLHTLEHGHTPLRVHLVGHSTGGLDANLLTNESPVGGGAWTDVDPRMPYLHERIRSVISIASPHQGACITRDPLARLVSHYDPRGIPAALRVMARFGASSLHDVELSELLTSAARERGKAWRFVRGVLSRWALLSDLDPATQLLDAKKLAPHVIRRSFVTIAGHPIPGAGAEPGPDALFRDFFERAAGWNAGCTEEGKHVQASVERVRRALSSATDDWLIKAPGVALPRTIDASCNDGVVNTARQLVDPTDQDELAGVIVADHFDVVGYYDRSLWVVDDDGQEHAKTVTSGLLHSGSRFRDDEFFQLYRRVASEIAATVA